MLLAAGVFGLGAPELLIVLVVVMLIFGASRVADLGGSLGKGIREFKKNVADDTATTTTTTTTTAVPVATMAAPPVAPVAAAPIGETISAVRCPSCGTLNVAGSRHCNQCGAAIATPVS